MSFSKLLDKIISRNRQVNNKNRFIKDTYLKISDFFRKENIKNIMKNEVGEVTI